MLKDNPKVAWLILALSIGSFAIGVTEFSTMSMLPLIKDEFGIQNSNEGYLVSAYALGVVIGSPLIAACFARFRHRTLLLMLMGFFACCHALAVFAPSFQALLVIRFLSGMPHGAYFAIASLVAAGVVDQSQRTQAVGLVMMGSTIAVTLGVLVSSWIGEFLSWRLSFFIECIIFALNAFIIYRLFPADYTSPLPATSFRQELSVLNNKKVWLTLLTTAVGFGGYFAVFTYASGSLRENTNLPVVFVPVIMGLFGLGMTLSNFYVTRLFAANPFRGVSLLFLMSVFSLLAYAFLYQYWWCVAVLAVIIGLLGSTSALVQVSLMNVANKAQTLAAALNHSACNIANFIGPILARSAKESWGWGATGVVGSLLCLSGFLIGVFTLWYIGRQTDR